MSGRRGLPQVGLVVGLLATAACDQGIQSLADTAKPLAIVKVHLANDPSVFLPMDSSVTAADKPNFRVGVLWADKPNTDRYCLEALQSGGGKGMPVDPSATQVVAQGCSDPFGFAPGLIGPSAPIEPGGDAELVFLDLPGGGAFVGDPMSRVAYGAIVLYNDRGKIPNEILGLTQAQYIDFRAAQQGMGDSKSPTNTSDPGEGGGQGGPGGGQGGPGGGPGGGGVSPPPGELDYVYGTTFLSMIKPNTRLSFREGTWEKGILFYPIIGCEPPDGFSIIDVAGLPTASSCKYATVLEKTVELSAQASETVRSVQCRQRAARYQQPPETLTLTTAWVCADKNHLVFVDPPGPCKGLNHFLLKGCQTDPTCETPQWDIGAHPPAWWPCADAPDPVPKTGGKK